MVTSDLYSPISVVFTAGNVTPITQYPRSKEDAFSFFLAIIFWGRASFFFSLSLSSGKVSEWKKNHWISISRVQKVLPKGLLLLILLPPPALLDQDSEKKDSGLASSKSIYGHFSSE